VGGGRSGGVGSRRRKCFRGWDSKGLCGKCLNDSRGGSDDPTADHGYQCQDDDQGQPFQQMAQGTLCVARVPSLQSVQSELAHYTIKANCGKETPEASDEISSQR